MFNINQDWDSTFNVSVNIALFVSVLLALPLLFKHTNKTPCPSLGLPIGWNKRLVFCLFLYVSIKGQDCSLKPSFPDTYQMPKLSNRIKPLYSVYSIYCNGCPGYAEFLPATESLFTRGHSITMAVKRRVCSCHPIHKLHPWESTFKVLMHHKGLTRLLNSK